MKEFIEQAVGDELLIFDSATNDCHTLTPQAIFVRQMLESQVSECQIVAQFKQQFPQHSDHAEEMVSQLIEHLSSLRLAQAQANRISSVNLGRRQVLKVAGFTLVASVLAPRAAAASSVNGLEITQAFYFNNQVAAPTTFASCGNLGADASCPGLDITSFLQGRVVNGSPDTFTSVACTNAALPGGDPCVGTLKECSVTYCCNGTFTTVRFCENTNIVIPPCP